MKHIRLYTLILACVVAFVTSCKDDSIELIPEWETAVHGLAGITSANKDFKFVDTSLPVNIDLQWVSIDQKMSVTKMELFVLFDEDYIDNDGNPALARHGGTTGISFRVYEGSAVPANRTAVNFGITQAELYTLYSAATFDYGNGEVSVFNNPGNPYRTTTNRFMWEDHLTIRWEFTGDDGRLFKKWGVSVCTEFPGANCQVALGVICAESIQDPTGTWVFTLADNYGDGWQGGYIGVEEDEVEVQQIRIPDGGGSSGADTYTWPGTGATDLRFVYHNDAFNSEVEFRITSPSGNVVADIKGNPVAGEIKLDLCLE